MPTTPSGTAYTVSSATLPTHGDCYWAVANDAAGDVNIPTVLYGHGSQGAANQFATLAAWADQRNWLIDNGWAWVEGSGGAVTGAYNWGNAEAQAAYPAYLNHADGVFDVGPVVLLGRSMGVVPLLSVFTQSDIAGDLTAMINNSGVSTMLVGTEANAPVDATDAEKDAAKAAQCTAFYFGTAIRDAYNVSSYAQLKAFLQGAGTQFCPENWEPSVWSGKKILCCYGDADTTVPWNVRGASPLRTIWSGQPALDVVSVRPGGDHSGTNGSYLDVAAMTNFLVTVTGGVVEPEPPATYTRISDTYVLGPAGQRYRVVPRPMEVPPT